MQTRLAFFLVWDACDGQRGFFNPCQQYTVTIGAKNTCLGKDQLSYHFSLKCIILNETHATSVKFTAFSTEAITVKFPGHKSSGIQFIIINQAFNGNKKPHLHQGDTA